MTRSTPTRTAFTRTLVLLLALLAFGLLAACGGPLNDAFADTEVVIDEVAESEEETVGEDAGTPPGRDLSGEDLSGEDLSGEDLTDADLTDADLTDADLIDVSAPRANFAFASLTGARLNGGDFSGANFTCADLRGTHLAGADFSGADFTGATLDGAETPGASTKLDGAIFYGTTWTDGTTRAPGTSVDCEALRAE